MSDPVISPAPVGELSAAQELAEFLPEVSQFLKAEGATEPAAVTLTTEPAEPVAEESEESDQSEAVIDETPAEPVAEVIDEDEVPAELASQPHVKKMLKRIDKLTAAKYQTLEERDAARAEIATLKAELETAKAKPLAAPAAPSNPLAELTTVAQIEEATQHAKQVREWALKNWDGGEVATGKDGETKYYPAEEVRAIFAHHLAIIEDHAPAQLAALQAQENYTAELAKQSAAAVAAYPWLAKPETEEAKAVRGMIEAMPEIQRFADHQIFLADMVAGKTARLAAEAAKAGGNKPAAPAAPVKKAPPLAPASPGRGVASARPTANAQKDAQEAALLKRAEAGDQQALTQLMALA